MVGDGSDFVEKKLDQNNIEGQQIIFVLDFVKYYSCLDWWGIFRLYFSVVTETIVISLSYDNWMKNCILNRFFIDIRFQVDNKALFNPIF